MAKSRKTIVVRNKRPTLLTMPAECVLRNGVLVRQLNPGDNEVDADLWEEVSKNPAVNAWCKAKWLKVDKTRSEAIPLADDLESVDIGKAISWVKACSDRGQLGRWLKNDEREAVQLAIEERLISLGASESIGGGGDQDDD